MGCAAQPLQGAGQPQSPRLSRRVTLYPNRPRRSEVRTDGSRGILMLAQHFFTGDVQADQPGQFPSIKADNAPRRGPGHAGSGSIVGLGHDVHAGSTRDVSAFRRFFNDQWISLTAYGPPIRDQLQVSPICRQRISALSRVVSTRLTQKRHPSGRSASRIATS